MHDHGIPDEQSETLLESVGSLPAEKGLAELLCGSESHNYKLGYLAAMILNWRDEGLLAPSLLTLANAIDRHAREVGIEK